VLLAVAEYMNIHSQLIPRIATGFCGGIAYTGGHCGAVSGAIMAINLALGRNTPSDERQSCYDAVRLFLDGFTEQFGALDCPKLIGLDLSKPEAHEMYQQKGSSEQCTNYVTTAARMVVDILGRIKNTEYHP
jgi:C_GCAxxG_C_C family probable redox protein